MTQSTVGGFFTGGGKGITWPDTPGAIQPDGTPGRTMVTGTITAIHPPEAVQDPKTGQPTDKQQVRIELLTAERDPAADFDDGARTLYVKSYMRGAVGDALRKAGVPEPKIGGTLTVVFTKTEPPERPGLSPSKHFEATYVPPSAQTAGYFGNGAQAPAPQPQYAGAQAMTQPPPFVPPQQQTVMQPTPGQPGFVQQPEPPRPQSISEQAWAAMPLDTKIQLAKTMSEMPPF